MEKLIKIIDGKRSDLRQIKAAKIGIKYFNNGDDYDKMFLKSSVESNPYISINDNGFAELQHPKIIGGKRSKLFINLILLFAAPVGVIVSIAFIELITLILSNI